MRVNLVVRRIALLRTMDEVADRLCNAAVAFEGGRVAWVGPDQEAPLGEIEVDGSECIGLPGLVDCHTHAVWAGSRADEFERRLAGETYSSILQRGGGILSTVRATRAATEVELTEVCAKRLRRFLEQGVCTVEVKSGYGLNPDTEPRLLRAAREAGRQAGVRVLGTFLGGHAVPPEAQERRSDYVRQVIEVQLPLVADLAEYIDVYVDRGAFSLEEGQRILEAGIRCGLRPRIHAEQVEYTGAARMAAELGALSADHLERIDEEGIAAMAKHGTVAVLLPGAMLYLRDSAPPVARLRAAGVPLAVATDMNPGSSPVGDLWACATLACLMMGLTVEEALLGITKNAGRALGREDLGVLRPGAVGDLALFEPPPGEPPGVTSLIQHFGGHVAAVVVRDGEVKVDPQGRAHRRA